ncbi:MAG: hypothetical protein ACPGYY_10965 [Bacteroidia bacterium]
MNKLLYLFLILVSIYSCTSDTQEKEQFPEILDVNNLDKTDFVATLESKFSTSSNIIYGATLPFAWDEIRTTIGLPLNKFTSNELDELNKTTSYEGVLDENEYNTSVEIDGNQIRAKAFFKNSLPFERPMTRFGKPLKFGNSNVESFGFWGSSFPASINYFISDDEFSVSLFPKNKGHEIILIMPHGNKKTMSFEEYFTRYSELSKESGYQTFSNQDHVNIPVIEFNLDKKYSEFIGSTFSSDVTDYEVTEAYQRNAFILNEKGAEVESEAMLEVTESAEEIEEPKSMIFNRPFIVFLKKTNSEHPYFAVYIANEELLLDSES